MPLPEVRLYIESKPILATYHAEGWMTDHRYPTQAKIDHLYRSGRPDQEIPFSAQQYLLLGRKDDAEVRPGRHES
jgi:hypothetical protein